jgi:hypothetical protein
MKRLYTILDGLPCFRKLIIEKDIIDVDEEAFYKNYKTNSKGNFKLELMVSILDIQDNSTQKNPQTLIPKISQVNASHLRIMTICQSHERSYSEVPIQRSLSTNIKLYLQMLTALESYPNKVTLDLEYFPAKHHKQEVFEKILNLLKNENVRVNHFKLILVLDEILEKEFANFAKILAHSNRIKTLEIMLKCSGDIFPTFEKQWVINQFAQAIEQTKNRPKSFILKVITKTINELDYMLMICSKISSSGNVKEQSISIDSPISSSALTTFYKAVEDDFLENNCERLNLTLCHRDGEVLFKEDFDFYIKIREVITCLLKRSPGIKKLNYVAKISPFFQPTNRYFSGLVESFKEESHETFEYLMKKFPRTDLSLEFQSKIPLFFKAN